MRTLLAPASSCRAMSNRHRLTTNERVWNRTALNLAADNASSVEKTNCVAKSNGETTNGAIGDALGALAGELGWPCAAMSNRRVLTTSARLRGTGALVFLADGSKSTEMSVSAAESGVQTPSGAIAGVFCAAAGALSSRVPAVAMAMSNRHSLTTNERVWDRTVLNLGADNAFSIEKPNGVAKSGGETTNGAMGRALGAPAGELGCHMCSDDSIGKF